jgi:hypothetical protein
LLHGQVTAGSGICYNLVKALMLSRAPGAVSVALPMSSVWVVIGACVWTHINPVRGHAARQDATHLLCRVLRGKVKHIAD